MVSITETYTDYNGTVRTETFNFNLNKAEVMELEMGVSGGLAEMIKNIVDAKNGPEIIKTFKKIVLMAYGVKSPDGREFIKDDKLTAKFVGTEAYANIFMRLATDTKAATEFVNGIIPKNMNTEVAALETQQNANVVTMPTT